MMGSNAVAASLDAGETVAGAWAVSGSPRVAEVLSRTGVDWVGVDTEHAPYGPVDVETMVRAIEPAATPFVRVPSVAAARAGAVKRALDAGAGGVIVPSVDAREDAEAAVEATYLPPLGSRGVAGTTRANEYGESFDEYVGSVNDATTLVVQIESPAGVADVEEIVSVEGVDVAFVGENDLATAMGYPGEKTHPAVVDAVESVRTAALDADVVPGIAARSPAARTERASSGYRFFLLGADVHFMREGVAAFL